MIEVLDKIRHAGGTIEVVGGDLRLRVPKGLLTPAERSLLAEHKAEVVRLLAADEPVVEDQHDEHAQHGDHEHDHEHGGHALAQHLDEDQDAGGWDEAVDPPAPCHQCGSLMLWQDFGGKWHCQRCEPAVVSERLREQAARLRRQAPPPVGGGKRVSHGRPRPLDPATHI
jgi:hypothetical protein